MNELQLVLLIFAVIVLGVLYFLSKKRQASQATSSDAETSAVKNTREEASEALNALGEKHPPLSQNAESRLQDDPESEIPANQTRLQFGEEFEPAIPLEEEKDVTVPKAKHHVLEVDELPTLEEAGFNEELDKTPSFGIPKDQEGESPGESVGEHAEPQIFALLVLSTGGSGQEFTMDAVNQALLGVGLNYSASNQIYVTTDSKGREVIRVANILEPGTFPTDHLHNYTTPGLAMILQLPSSVRAPAAMHDLIMMARKVSQRLNGRLYNMERHLIKESDLQAMRDAAVEYESKPL